MERRRYLIAYDIPDDKRRARVFKACERQADHTQYSVFMAELDEQELVALQSELDEIINSAEDQILFADLGLASRDAGRIIAVLGRPYEPPVRGIVV
ncbi:MAG: CRISPR-associated endonuclease Cas2 [Planctomycetota bacterium]|nr:CRISPR-associated endonuclease Cas2 [Planctomycetota bacterium]